MGYPTSQREFMGDTVFAWQSEASMPIPNGFNEPTFFRIQCKIEVATDNAGTIKTSHLDGDGRACWRYANALR